MSTLRPRRCVLEKGSDGYGFHLHGEKGKTGQFIRLVEPDTPAEAAGLRAGDRLAFVNGESVDGESHAQVVSRIRATPGSTLELIVMDPETLELLQRHSLMCREEYVTEGIPIPGAADSDSDEERAASANGSRRTSSPVPPVPLGENGDRASQRSSLSSKGDRSGPRPRLCRLQKGPGGYGFNLHSDKSRPGQFIRAVDDDSAAQRAGLRPNDKIVQVNGTSVWGKQHSEVVAAIKASGEEVRLLVVDAEADEFFTKCDVLPTEEHVSGPLPEPREDRAPEEEPQEAPAEREAKTSVSSESSASSQTSQTGPGTTATEEPVSDSLGLGLSVAQARERALQKRSGKNAPRMDWNKRREVFSNL